jgi:hypothetical protein
VTLPETVKCDVREGVERRFCKGWLNAYRKPVDPQAAPGVG